MTREPDFHELLNGEDLSPEERARLERVHELLLEAGPPPELTPALAEPETAQREIRQYAAACEQFLEQKMPVTYAAFVASGRIAP